MNPYDIPSHDAIVTTDPDQARRDDLAERAEKAGERFDELIDRHAALYGLRLVLKKKALDVVIEFAREQFIMQELEDS